MKLSLSWIKDYVNIPEDADLKKLAYDLTMSTVEVEDVEDLARRFDNMLVGVIFVCKEYIDSKDWESLKEHLCDTVV